MKALVLNGVVVDTAEEAFDVHESMQWFDAPVGVKTGYTFDGALFNAPVVAPATYSQLRLLEYPPITDYIDGVVKGDQAQIDAYIQTCLAVKAKYPKPE